MIRAASPVQLQLGEGVVGPHRSGPAANLSNSNTPHRPFPDQRFCIGTRPPGRPGVNPCRCEGPSSRREASHPRLVDVIGVGREGVGEHDIGWAAKQMHEPLGLGLGSSSLASRAFVRLHQAFAPARPARLVEGEESCRADQHLVRLGRSTTRAQPILLSLGAANDRRRGPLPLIDGDLQILRYPLSSAARQRGFRYFVRRRWRLGPGGRRKGIIHIDIGPGRPAWRRKPGSFFSSSAKKRTYINADNA